MLWIRMRDVKRHLPVSDFFRAFLAATCIYTLYMSNDVDLTECRQCLCQAARVEAQRLTRMFDVRLRPFDLTINQFSLLATLVLAGPQTVTRLAGRLGIHRT